MFFQAIHSNTVQYHHFNGLLYGVVLTAGWPGLKTKTQKWLEIYRVAKKNDLKMYKCIQYTQMH